MARQIAGVARRAAKIAAQEAHIQHMIHAPVVLLPPPLEAWHEQGAQHAFIVFGAGPLERAPGRLQLLGLQGAGVLAGRFLFRLHDAQVHLGSGSSAQTLLSQMSQARGSLALQAYDVDQQSVHLLNDPLGGAPIYAYQDGELRAYSSDLGSMIQVLRARRATLTPEPRYFAAGALTGTQTYGADSPFREIRVLRRGLGLRIEADGQVHEVKLAPAEVLYASAEPYARAFERVRTDILDNVRLASEADVGTRFAHLTAGMDSRLVLAALMQSQLQERYCFACIKTSSDWVLAGQLAGELGLRFSDFEGMCHGKGYAANYIDWVTRASRNSAGALVVGHDPRWLPADTLLLQGGYGEVMRSFNHFAWDGRRDDLTRLAHQLWRYAGFPSAQQAPDSIWAPAFLDHVVQRLEVFTKEAATLGLADDAFTNYLYVEGRNRYWFGLQSFYANRVRTQFDPLYSCHGVGLPLLLDFERRKDNFVGLDLMRSLNPDLLGYDFDRACISPRYEQERGAVKRLPFSGRLPLPVPVPKTVSKPWPGPVDSISTADETDAKAMGMMPLVVAGVRRLAGRAIEEIAASPNLREVYEPERLAALWQRGAPSGKASFQALHGVLSTLLLSGWVP